MKSYFPNFLISFNFVVGEVNKTHIALISFEITFCQSALLLRKKKGHFKLGKHLVQPLLSAFSNSIFFVENIFAVSIEIPTFRRLEFPTFLRCSE